jgi:two-component system NarL family response regulator
MFPYPSWGSPAPRARDEGLTEEDGEMVREVTGSIKVLVVDDHPVVRTGLVAMVDSQPDMTAVAEAASGEEAVELFRRHRPAVTLMDLRMPGMSGVEAIARIRQESPDAHVLVLTTYDGDEEIYRALQVGALSYLLKDMPREEILETIRAVHAGAHRLPPPVAARLAERIHQSELTSREIEVLERIASGMSNKRIAGALGISEGTVKTHVNNILGKLGADDRTHAVTLALRRGVIHLA